MERTAQLKAIQDARLLWEQNHSVVVYIATQWLKEWFPKLAIDLEHPRFRFDEHDWIDFDKRWEQLIRALVGPALRDRFHQIATECGWSYSAEKVPPWNFGGPVSNKNDISHYRNDHEVKRTKKESNVGPTILNATNLDERVLKPMRENAAVWRRLFDEAEADVDTPEYATASGFHSAKELVAVLGVHPERYEAFLVQLTRQRKKLGDDNWEAVPNPKSRSEKYRYRASAPEVRELARRYRNPK